MTRGACWLLSGRTHDVLTGVVSCARPGVVGRSDTRVRFRPLTRAEIDWYVASGEPQDKAGAYGSRARVAVRRSRGRLVQQRSRPAGRRRPGAARLPGVPPADAAQATAEASRRRLTGPAAEGILFRGRTVCNCLLMKQKASRSESRASSWSSPWAASLLHAQRGHEFYKHVDEVMVNPRPGTERISSSTGSW